MDLIPKNLCEIHQLGPATGEWLVGQREVPAFKFTRTIVAGYSYARPGYRFVRHNPAFSQILACIEGEGEVLIEGRWKRCPAGFAYLNAPGVLSAYHVPAGGHWRICWVLYEEEARITTLERGAPARLIRANARGLHLGIEGLCHEAGSDAEDASLEFWAALVHRQVLRMVQPGEGEPRLAQLWSAVRQNLGSPWNLKRMAKTAGMSQESLRRLCLKQVGRPPLAHITHLRMFFAADLLACTQEKVMSIATRVGYGDPFAFSNAFKREMGLPPAQYRARQRREEGGA